MIHRVNLFLWALSPSGFNLFSYQLVSRKEDYHTAQMDKTPLLSDAPKGVLSLPVTGTMPPEGSLAIMPLPTRETVQNLKDIDCKRTAYKAEEISLASNSHSVIGVLLAELALMMTAEIGIFTLFSSGEKGCVVGKMLAGVATTIAAICLLFTCLAYWQLLDIEAMISDLQDRLSLLLFFKTEERKDMALVQSNEQREDNILKAVNDLCESISQPVRIQKLLLFYKVLVCILATIATVINMLMGYKSYAMMCGQIDQ